jgi:tetratricopeptide (TPR) repeat protein
MEPSVRAQITAALADVRAKPDAASLGRLGKIFHAYEQYDRAATCFARAHELEPREVRWAYYLGLAHSAAGRTGDAIASLREAARLDPRYLPIQIKLGGLLLGSGEIGEALRIYDRAVAENPRSALAYFGLGGAQSAQGKAEQALVSYRRACDLAPEFGAAHYALALLYRDRGEREKARAHLIEYRLHRAKRPPLLDPLGDDIEAQKGGPYHLLEEGRRLRNAGRPGEAAAILEKALALKGDLVEARIHLIAAYGALGEFARAEAQFRRAVEQSPDAAEAHYNFGVALLAQQRSTDAVAAFERALAIAPWYADAHNNLGYLLLRENRADEAVAHFQAALTSNPQHRDARFNLAQVLQARGRHEEALAHFLQTVAVDDNRTAVFMFYLADAYSRAGNTEQALRYALESRTRAMSNNHPELLPHIDRLVAALKRARQQ